jgi:hypothetical protein
MFRQWKRLAAVSAAIVLPILAALWSAVLSKLTPTPNHTGGIYDYLPYAYVGIICILSAASAYFTHFKPARDLEKPVLTFLTTLAENPLKLGKKHNIGPRMNLMVVYRPWYFPVIKRIKVVWSKNMESYPDVRFSCYCDQGVSGQALKRGLPVLADCSGSDKSAFKFSATQLEHTAHVKAVWSWPIYEVNNKGQQTGEVIGILNLDGIKDGAFQALEANTDAFEKVMKKFAEVASTIV